MLRSVKATKRLPRLLCLRVTGTGTAAINEGSLDATLVDNGTGDYSLTLLAPSKRTPIVTVGVLTAQTIHQVHTVSASLIRIKLFDAADGTTAKDGVFHLHVVCHDTADEQ